MFLKVFTFVTFVRKYLGDVWLEGGSVNMLNLVSGGIGEPRTNLLELTSKRLSRIIYSLQVMKKPGAFRSIIEAVRILLWDFSP